MYRLYNTRQGGNENRLMCIVSKYLIFPMKFYEDEVYEDSYLTYLTYNVHNTHEFPLISLENCDFLVWENNILMQEQISENHRRYAAIAKYEKFVHHKHFIS